MRIVAGVFGIAGASVCVLSAFMLLLLSAILSITEGRANAYDVLIFATAGIALVAGASGLVGSGFTLYGKLGMGAFLMLISPLGVIASLAAYLIALPRITPPMFEPAYPEVGFYVAFCVVTFVMIAAAMLAYISRGRRPESASRTS